MNARLAEGAAMSDEKHEELLAERERESAALSTSKAELDAAVQQIAALEAQVEELQGQSEAAPSPSEPGSPLGSRTQSSGAVDDDDRRGLLDEVTQLRHMRTASGIAASRLRSELSELRTQLAEAKAYCFQVERTASARPPLGAAQPLRPPLANPLAAGNLDHSLQRASRMLDAIEHQPAARPPPLPRQGGPPPPPSPSPSPSLAPPAKHQNM